MDVRPEDGMMLAKLTLQGPTREIDGADGAATRLIHALNAVRSVPWGPPRLDRRLEVD
jgi:hypothetical protein